MKMDAPLIQEKPKSWTKSVIFTVILVFAMCTLAGKHMMGSREQALGEPESQMSQPIDPCRLITVRSQCYAAVENGKSLKCSWDPKINACRRRRRKKINIAPPVAPESACLPQDDADGTISTFTLGARFLCAFAAGTPLQTIKESCYHVYMERIYPDAILNDPTGTVALQPNEHFETQLVSSTTGAAITTDPVADDQYNMIFQKVENPAAPAPAAPARIRPRAPGDTGTCDEWCGAQGLRTPIQARGKRCDKIRLPVAQGGAIGCNQRACSCRP